MNGGSTSRQAVKDTGHGAVQSRFQVPESVFRDLEGNDTTETALTTQRDSETSAREPMRMVGTSEITASTHELVTTTEISNATSEITTVSTHEATPTAPRSSNITSEAPTTAATSLSATSSSSPENGTSQSSHPVTTTEPVSVVTSNDSRTQGGLYTEL